MGQVTSVTEKEALCVMTFNTDPEKAERFKLK